MLPLFYFRMNLKQLMKMILDSIQLSKRSYPLRLVDSDVYVHMCVLMSKEINAYIHNILDHYGILT